MADSGHQFFILPNENNHYLHKRVMSRHETVNKRIKQFKIIKYSFRHNVEKHPMVFYAVVNLVQLMIENREPLFTV